MPHYLRPRIPGGTFFFTVVTFRRRKLLITEESRGILEKTINKVQSQYPFISEAFVLLPDHLHTIWTLPAGDTDFSKRWGLIKANFSKGTKALFHMKQLVNPSRKQRQETTIWQRRFWEHLIRDDDDFQKHFDYLHYNPVKHGLVQRVKDWPHSSFHRYVKEGIYPEDWGAEVSFSPDDAFGE